MNGKRFISYVLRLGLIKGIQNFLLLRLRRRTGILRVSLNSGASNIYLRSNKEDRQAFEDVFVKQIYKLKINLTPKIIIDGGAHIGCASLFFVNRYPDAKIFAIEPARSNLELLKKNTAMYPQIEVMHGGIWYRKSQVRIKNPLAKSAAFTLTETTGKTEDAVEGYTIRDICAIQNLQYIDILKLDIEGSEKELFSDYEGWLDRVGVVIAELHDRHIPGCAAAFKKAIITQNFRCSFRGHMAYAIRENYF